INIIGGIIVGVAQNDMSLTDASRIFTLLTVGDGLVAQIPALIISTAAGIIATRNSNNLGLGDQVGQAFSAHPKAFYITAGVLVLFALIPGFPALPFLAVAGVVGFAGFRIEQNKAQVDEQKVQEAITESAIPKSESLESLLPVELIQ